MPTWNELMHHAFGGMDITPTGATLGFEVFVFLSAAVALTVLSRFKDRILRRFWIMALGVLIFQVFTAPMWNNLKMGVWAYVYRDVSWILTFGWATMVLSTVIVVDLLLPRVKEWQRFLCYLAALTALVVVFERIVVAIGIRSYAPEVMAVIGGSYVPILGVPYHLFYYVPVFMSLVIGFYKYWSNIIDRPAPVPVPAPWLWSLGVAVAGVFLFEVMIDPMVVNTGLPPWTYLYRDISFLMTGGWVLLIWLSVILVEQVFPQLGPRRRLAAYLVVLVIIALPIEAWLINAGIRTYGPSAVENFAGFRVPLLNVPTEVAFAIPLYMALVIGFIRYWERVAQEALIPRR